MFLCIVVGKVFLDCLSSRYYHASRPMVFGVIVPVGSVRKVATCACLISIQILVFFSSIKGTLD